MAAAERIARLVAAGAPEEAARAALDAAEDDLLEAALLLEREGRLSPPAGGGSYATGGPRRTAPASEGGPLLSSSAAGQAREGRAGRSPLSVLRDLAWKGPANSLEAWRRGRQVTAVPLLVLLVLVVFFFWITVAILAAGLLLGFRYRLAGPDLDQDVKEGVRRAADRAGRLARDLAGQARAAWARFQDGHRKH